ncbi:hypothetical protein PGT21_008851 [Puccinia graminis f. sp. tritici]|uniref:Homeobox domain-containing protein n=1 Tax=Puccinia graminis f. sp. tritici TaxID=56615 RepID=A0A5B0NKY4_PUCGR|nr:hypothetical protein PGT21_008851 [Puccinia graminis f. sp. tritici]KAA1128816.1 hypothetical protein PGTUg99_023541 [Puccinia graminis f. sp. tritici]
MPSHHDAPHHRRGSHSNRRRHVIPFGHPYACTPALNAIFKHNPTPSHSQVTTIMQQTGLKRKQITSWFWRKRKESIDQEQDDLRHVQFPKRSSSQSLSDQAAASRSGSSAPQIRSGSGRDQEQDEEYRPPSYVKIKPRSHHRSTDLNPRPSGHPGRAKLTTTVDRGVRTHLPSDKQNLISPSVSSKSKPPLSYSSSSTSPPQRSPILIRCRLRPLSQRMLNETVERQPDESNGSNKSEFLGGCPEVLEASTYDSSSIKSNAAQQIKDSSRHSSLVTKQSSPGTSIPPTVSSKQNPNDEVLCDLDGPSPHHLPTNSHASMEEMRHHLAPSSTASPKQKQDDTIVTNINESPDTLPTNTSYASRCDIYRRQLGSGNVPQEYSVSLSRRMVSGKSSWLRPERRFSYSGNGQMDSISRNTSNTFRDSSSNPIDSSTSTPTEAGHGICFRVSQEDLAPGSASNASTNSLGHEVHRWSELSDVDGASRYSSESIESRASLCNNVVIEDYSALLNTSSDQVMCESSAMRESEPAEEMVEFRDNPSQKSLSLGTRSISHPYYPLEHSNQIIAAFPEQQELSFTSSACILNQDTPVEEDPRLFMVEGNHPEFFDLLDWNPLGSFPNGAS